MINNAAALLTLIRNKLTREESWAQKIQWFHEKGVSINKVEDDLYYLYADTRGHISELSIVANGLIYRGHQLLCYPGKHIEATTLEKARENKTFLWDEKTTYFFDKIPGIGLKMYYDPGVDKWRFAQWKKAVSGYDEMLTKRLYNLEGSADQRNTYIMVLLENRGGEAGLYLEKVYNNKTQKEVSWEKVDRMAINMKIKRPKRYKFEGFNSLEETDFPLIAHDKSGNIVLLNGLK